MNLFNVTGTIPNMHVRGATETDLPSILEIQRQTPEAAQWDVSEYPLLIAESGGTVIGFLAWRKTAPDEAEILNLAVAAPYRRQGAAQAMIRALQTPDIFLEVRQSNVVALALYKKAGFIEAGIRYGYYSHPLESGIVMRLQS